MRDRLVCGLRSESMQKKLLSVKDLTFHDALETAQAMESAAQNSRSLQQPPSNTSSVPVNKVHTGTSRKPPQARFPPCSRCGRSGHLILTRQRTEPLSKRLTFCSHGDCGLQRWFSGRATLIPCLSAFLPGSTHQMFDPC